MQTQQLQSDTKKPKLKPLAKLIDIEVFGLPQYETKQGSYGQVHFTDKGFALKIIPILNTENERQEAEQINQGKKQLKKNTDFYTMYYNEREMELQEKWYKDPNLKFKYVAQIKSDIRIKSLDGQRYAILPLEKFDYNMKDYLSLNNLSFKNKMKLSVEICKGVKFLHDQELMHRDINLKNILVKENEQNGVPYAVVADFSLAHKVREVNTRKVGTIFSKEIEQPPQPLENDQLTQSQMKHVKDGSQNNIYVPYNESFDIFLLGITLIAIFLEDVRVRRTYSDNEKQEMIKNMNENYPNYQDFIKVLERCLSNNDKSRPKIEELIKIAESILLDIKKSEESSVIKDMRDYQFKIFTKSDLQKVKDLEKGQQAFIKDGLNQGFKMFNLYLEGKLNDRSALKDVFNFMYNDYIMKMKYPQKISSGDCLDISENIPKIYKKVHEEYNKQLTPQEKLFLEFLIGFAVVLRINCICCALLFKNSNQLGDITKKSIQEEFLDFENIMEREGTKRNFRDQFWNSQYICLKIIQKIQRELFLGENQSLNNQEMEEKWAIIKKLMINDSQLNGTFQNLCSLRYIPKDEKYFLCFAQILHWRGFGGQGELLPSEEDPYVKELIQYRDLSIRYVRNESSHFGGQQVLSNMFIPILKSVQAHYQKFVQFAGKKFFEKNPQKIMRTYDFGSGPTIPAVDPLVSIYQDKIEVIASDIDGHSFEGLLKSNKAKYVTFLDLNYMKDEDFETQLDQRDEIVHKFKDSVDLFTSRLVIHQCIDFNLGHNILPYLMNYISFNLVVGGMFAWFDTGPMCYMQAPIIPGNLTDREGCVPTNIFRYLSLEDIDKIGVKYEEGYKVLLYIPQVLATSPDAYNLFGGLYMFRSFINVYLKEDEYIVFKDKLKQLNENKKEKQFNDYVKGLLITKFGKLIEEIDQHMNDQ